MILGAWWGKAVIDELVVGCYKRWWPDKTEINE